MKTKTPKGFVSYSHKDKKMCDEFLEQIKCLERIYNIEHWYDGMIPAGGDIDDEIKLQLGQSDFVFLLVSPAYISSYYCYEKELKEALERHEKGCCKVIPVIIRKYPPGEYLFSNLKFVPTDGRAVGNFKSHNDGFVDAITGIKNILNEKPSHSQNNKSHQSKSSSKNNGAPKTQVTANNQAEIKHRIIKNGKPTNVALDRCVFEGIISYGESLPRFVHEMNTLLKESLERVKKDSQKASTRSRRYSIDVEDFIFQTCGYVQKLCGEYDNTCIHVRKKENHFYYDYTELGYSKNDLSIAPIVAENGMIECSKKNNMPVIKNLNNSLHKNSHPSEKIKRNYITFAFNNISKLFDIDLSMCISIIGTNASNEIFVAMSVMRFDLLIERYLIQYFERCKKIDTNYDEKTIMKLEV